MTHTLVLLRHAKAENPGPNVHSGRSRGPATDQDRSLTSRGHADAAAAGTWLAAQDLIPDLVLCSAARRTRQTWHEVAIALATASTTETAGTTDAADTTSAADAAGAADVGPSGAAGMQVSYRAELYAATDRAALDLIASTDESVRTLLVIGHNPTVSQLSARLHAGTPEALRTAGIAVHEVPGEWASIIRTGAPLRVHHTARAS